MTSRVTRPAELDAQSDAVSFERMVSNSPDVIARFDLEGRYLYMSPAAEFAFGIRPSDTLGKSVEAVGPTDELAAAFRHALEQACLTKHEQRFHFSHATAGRTAHFSARVFPEFDPSKNVLSLLLFTHDVTSHVEAQLERDTLLIREQASRMQAEAAARARDEFLAIVSHELRSPLNGIQSWTHVLEAYVPMDQPLVSRAIGGIKLGVQQQVRLIDDLLDATLIMSGKLRLTKTVVVLEECIREAVSSLAVLAEEKRITVTKHIAKGVPAIEGDGKRIQQVIWNLLSNAIKFTPEDGKIDVSLDLVDDDVRVSVLDTGRGISPKFLPYLFDPFRQADESSTRRAGGIGLGLTLVRRLIELHGGRVAAESDGENLGSKFCVLLPLTLQTSVRTSGQTLSQDGPKGLASLRGVHVALVDDLKEARDSLAQLLEQAGAEVESFDSGKAVVAALGRLGAAQRPDVLICDIAMPEQDGYRTLQQIRENEIHRELAHLPAIALTAFSQVEDELKALACGFQVHLAKPVEPAELISILAALSTGDSRADANLEGRN